jgi:hypothetical protein
MGPNVLPAIRQCHNHADGHRTILEERSGLTRILKFLSGLEHQANCLCAVAKAQ